MGQADHKLAVSASLVAGLLSVAMCGICIGFMHAYSDRRLILTTSEVFRNWSALRNVYEDTTQYLPGFNPPSLAMARFDPWGTSLGQYEDMRDRGLITDAQFANVSASFDLMDLDALAETHPSVLYRLLSTAECTVPNARPQTSPASRSPGCQCIADTYLAFVDETDNASSRIPSEVRTRYAGRVLRCLDRRVTRKTATCGAVCSLHPVGLALYSNTVLFLSCLAFLLFSELNYGASVVVLQLIVCGAGVLCILPFVLMGTSANLLSILGLVLVILNLVHAAREDLEDAMRCAYETRVVAEHPHPLIVCICVNLHVVIPAFMIAVGVSNLARDFYAISSFGFAGFLLGVALQVCLYFFARRFLGGIHAFWRVWQCFIWDCWYSTASVRNFKLPLLILIGCVFTAAFIWLFSAYQDPAGVFVVSGSSGMLVFTLVILGIAGLMGLMCREREVRMEESIVAHHMFGYPELGLCCLVLLGNLLLGTLAIIDAAKD